MEGSLPWTSTATTWVAVRANPRRIADPGGRFKPRHACVCRNPTMYWSLPASTNPRTRRHCLPPTGPRLPLSLSLSLSLQVRRCSWSPPWSTGTAKHQANGFMGQAGWSCRRSRQPFDQRPRSRGTRTAYTNTSWICWSLLPWKVEEDLWKRNSAGGARVPVTAPGGNRLAHGTTHAVSDAETPDELASGPNR
jgi:hypothetical protein